MPYFGALPAWKWLFLRTCEFNPQVTWHFFADFDSPQGLPLNVLFTRMSLDDFRELASRKIGFEVCLPYPFKVCDFRPAYGVILSDFLGGYDFWAWGDTDVFYGDLMAGLKKNRALNCDVVSVRSEFLSGELTILRNTEFVNRLFEQSKDHRRVMSDRRGFDFEELGFFKGREIQSFTEVVVREYFCGRLRILMKDMGHNDRKSAKADISLRWLKGKLWDTHTGAESLLYHFLDLKRDPCFTVPTGRVDDVDAFSISQSGVVIDHELVQPNRRMFAHLRDRLHREVRRFRAIRRLKRKIGTDG